MQTPLERTVEILGPHPFDDPGKFRSLLLDLSGERSAFNTVLIHCVEAGIAVRLVECTDGFALKLQMTAAVERLHNEFGSDRQLASDVVAALAAFAQVKPVSKPPVLSDNPISAPPVVQTKVFPKLDTEPLPDPPIVESSPIKPQVATKQPVPVPVPPAKKSLLGWIVGLTVLFSAVVIGFVIWRVLSVHKNGTPISMDPPVELRLVLRPNTVWEEEAKLEVKVQRAEFAGTGSPTIQEEANVNSAPGTHAVIVVRSKFEVLDPASSQNKIKGTIKDITVEGSGLLLKSAEEAKVNNGATHELTYTDRGISVDSSSKVPIVTVELPAEAVTIGQKFPTHFSVFLEQVEAEAEVILFEWQSNRRCVFLRLHRKGTVDPGFVNDQPIPMWVDLDTGQVVLTSFAMKTDYVESSVRLYTEMNVTYSIVTD